MYENTCKHAVNVLELLKMQTSKRITICHDTGMFAIDELSFIEIKSA